LEAYYQTLSDLIMEEIHESDIIGSLELDKLVVLLPYADVKTGTHVQSRFEDALKFYDFKSKDFEILINTVTVIVMEANSFQVYISGEVRNPDVYRLRSETSLLQIIPIAGGFTDWANQKKILIIRNENGKEKRIKVNYKKIVNGDDPSSNIVLKAGDTIIVP
jgi:hypothetical protein